MDALWAVFGISLVVPAPAMVALLIAESGGAVGITGEVVVWELDGGIGNVFTAMVAVLRRIKRNDRGVFAANKCGLCHGNLPYFGIF